MPKLTALASHCKQPLSNNPVQALPDTTSVALLCEHRFLSGCTNCESNVATDVTKQKRFDSSHKRKMARLFSKLKTYKFTNYFMIKY
jgi:hypothetical protein